MTRRTTSDEAWSKGRFAALAGEPVQANPFRGGQVHVAWTTGWIDGNNSRVREAAEKAVPKDISGD